jgi:uncharacterized heparinase superfamily protein
MKRVLIKGLKYWHTLRYLRPVQFVGRFKLFFKQTNIDYSPSGPLRTLSGNWIIPAKRRQSMLSKSSFCFLNENHHIVSSKDWNNEQWTKLWIYNLHYFDDLCSVDAVQRSDWHRLMIYRWIDENPVGKGNGWEPYPSSLRIVNWIKWSLAGNHMEEIWLNSLVLQVRFLIQNLETHLMGNHLFANAKALMFAGSFFDGNEAKKWREIGLKLIKKELPEQLLSDGGNFELSTMYHMIFLEDLLDLTNLYSTYGVSVPNQFKDSISSMNKWLAVMCHPDGEISFFNDAALGITPSVKEVRDYGIRLLGSDKPLSTIDEFCKQCLFDLPISGYSRIQMKDMVAIIDRAAIGPDYLPGHAHADTLSFEMSLFGQRVIVNSGTSVYGTDENRTQERSTDSHSTVEIDEQDSSEVWSGFRVARRASVFDSFERETKGMVKLSACHDGYKRLSGKPVHCREWVFEDCLLTITDKVAGKGIHKVKSILPLHPRVKVILIKKNRAILEVAGNNVEITVDGNGELNDLEYMYHPEFGLSVESRKLTYHNSGVLPIEIITRIRW